MLSEEEAKRLIVPHLRTREVVSRVGNRVGWRVDGIDEAAAAIAAAAEQDRAEAEAKWDLHLVGRHKRIEQLEAQVAVMAQALGMWKVIIEMERDDEIETIPMDPYIWAQDATLEALQSAPTVLLRLDCKVTEYGCGERSISIPSAHEAHKTMLLQPSAGIYEHLDGDIGELFVIVHPARDKEE